METIIISILAALISLISLIFTVVTYIKQYGKSLYIHIDYGYAKFIQGEKFSCIIVDIVNNSNFPIYIKEIGFYAYDKEVEKCVYMPLWDMFPEIEDKTIKILQQESKEFFIKNSGFNYYVKENIKNNMKNKKIKFAVKDTTGKIFIKKGITNAQFYNYLKNGL